VIKNTLAGGVPGFVHLLAAALALRDNPGTFKACVPPVVEAVAAHRLVAVLGDKPLPRLVSVRPDGAAAEQVLVRPRLPVENPALEVIPERRVDDWDRLTFAALPEDRQAPLGVVKVPELDVAKLALAEPAFQEQM
jgi:hypothetical protein